VRRRREESQEDKSQVVVGFRTAYVFDVEQTDGAPLPRTAEVTGDPGEHTAALKRAIVARGISVEYADDLGGALGLSCLEVRSRIVPRGVPPYFNNAASRSDPNHCIFRANEQAPLSGAELFRPVKPWLPNYRQQSD
jgi:hypothetical protein